MRVAVQLGHPGPRVGRGFLEAAAWKDGRCLPAPEGNPLYTNNEGASKRPSPPVWPFLGLKIAKTDSSDRPLRTSSTGRGRVQSDKPGTPARKWRGGCTARENPPLLVAPHASTDRSPPALMMMVAKGPGEKKSEVCLNLEQPDPDWDSSKKAEAPY